MSKRRHNFGMKRFKEKSHFIFHARIALKSLILLFVRLIARGARIGKTHTQTHRHTDRHPRACAPRVNYYYQCKMCWNKALTFGVGSIKLSFRTIVFTQYMQRCFQSKCYYIHFSQIVPRVCTLVLFINNNN